MARKGAYELREALRGLPVELWVGGSELEGPGFWEGLQVRSVSPTAVVAADLVVQPALLEDAPRALLLARALGRPVVATAACGLTEGVSVVPFGNVDALRSAIETGMRCTERYFPTL